MMIFRNFFRNYRESCGLNLYGNIMVTTDKVNKAKGAKDFKDFIRKYTDGTEEKRTKNKKERAISARIRIFSKSKSH